MISIDPSKPLPHEQSDEHNKMDLFQELHSTTISMNGTKQEALSTEFSHNHSDHILIETTTSLLDNKEHESRDETAVPDAKGGDYENDQVNKDGVVVSDVIEDQKQTLSYPNETLEKSQMEDESDDTDAEKISSNGNIAFFKFQIVG